MEEAGRMPALLGFFDNEREALVDVAAVAAHAVRELGLAALGAAVGLDANDGVVGATGTLAGLGGFMKREHESP
jgi:hypothetical protein